MRRRVWWRPELLSCDVLTFLTCWPDLGDNLDVPCVGFPADDDSSDRVRRQADAAPLRATRVFAAVQPKLPRKGFNEQAPVLKNPAQGRSNS